MKSVVIGAGNAGRPVARILNYVGYQVQITDQKRLEDFAPKYQEILLQMEKEGVILNLGVDAPGVFNFDSAYISPTIPENSHIRKILVENDLKLIEHQEISRIIDDLIKIDIIGITGTLGKTSTTHITSQIFQSSGFKVWKCSSRHGNLLSEVIVDGIINDYHLKNDIAVFELPHGTSRLMSAVKLKIGVLTNIYPEHLDEFDDSLDKYVQRKLFIAKSSEILVSTPQCQEYLKPLRDDVIYYSPDNDRCDVTGSLEHNQLSLKYDFSSFKDKISLNDYTGCLVTDFKLMGYYFENSLAATAVALSYGLDVSNVKEGLSKFKGISGHLEYLGNFCSREVHFDAAFVPEGLVSTLEQFKNRQLIVLVDNPDTTTTRDKPRIGEVIGEYADILISSGYNETLGGVNMDAAQKVLDGVKNQNCRKFAVKDMITAGKTAIRISNPGDTIIHVGPGAITNYDDLKEKMIRGLKQGCKGA